MPDQTLPTSGVGAFPAGFAGILTGFGSNLYIQPNPGAGALVPLTSTQLGAKDLQAVAVADTTVTAIAVAANNLNPQGIGAFGPGAPAEVTLPLQGTRYANKIPTQSAPPSLALTVTYDPSNLALVLLSQDGNLGTTTRTAVITSTLAAGATTYTWYYAFNFRSTPVSWTTGPDNAHLGVVTLVPIGGNLFGYSYTTSP